MSKLRELMFRWDELEPSRCCGPFVLVLDEADNMKCVDEYGEGTINARWDEICIEQAVRSAIEARGWDYDLKTGRDDDGDMWYRATVYSHDNPITSHRTGESARRPCEAFLAPYIEAVEDTLSASRLEGGTTQ